MDAENVKLFFREPLALYASIDRLFGTPSVGICIAGIPEKEGHGLLGVENFLTWLHRPSLHPAQRGFARVAEIVKEIIF